MSKFLTVAENRPLRAACTPRKSKNPSDPRGEIASPAP